MFKNIKKVLFYILHLIIGCKGKDLDYSKTKENYQVCRKCGREYFDFLIFN
jgi:hypothetical protein